MNGPADRSVRLLLLLSGSLLVSDSARIAADFRAHAEPLSDLKVQVNSDPANRLRALPGIGPIIAERVIEQRSVMAFRNGDDLVRRVRGLGPAFIADYGGWLDFSDNRDADVDTGVSQVDHP
ncbi:hypothetical protein GC170_05935 [bacterium]|nr:hypothetical protein [bacterium]